MAVSSALGAPAAGQHVLHDSTGNDRYELVFEPHAEARLLQTRCKNADCHATRETTRHRQLQNRVESARLR